MSDDPEPTQQSQVRRRRKSIDIGEALSFMFKDPQWFVKLLVHGLLSLIPILGLIIILGWQRQIVENIKAEIDGLPAIDIGKSLSDGIPPFVALLNITIPAMILILGGLLWMAVAAIGGAVLMDEMNEEVFMPLGILIGMAGYFIALLFAFPLYVAAPETNIVLHIVRLPLGRSASSVVSFGSPMADQSLCQGCMWDPHLAPRSPWKYHDLWPPNSQHLRRGERIEDRMHSVYRL